MKFRLAGLDDWRRFAAHVKGLPWVRDGKAVRYLITVEEMRPTRNQAQNAYMWAMLNDISKQSADLLGRHYSAEVLHEYCKARFLGLDVVSINGDSRPSVRTTTKLSVREFSDYCDAIAAWAVSELGVTLNERGGEAA